MKSLRSPYYYVFAINFSFLYVGAVVHVPVTEIRGKNYVRGMLTWGSSMDANIKGDFTHLK